MDTVWTADKLRDLVRRAQQDNRWSDADIAKRAGIPQSTVLRFMAGGQPKDAMRVKIAKAIGV